MSKLLKQFSFIMKKILFLLLIINKLYAQKEDNVWLLGDWKIGFPIDTTIPYGINSLNFGKKPYPLNQKEWSDVGLDMNKSSICDKEGNLLLFYDGIDIYNKNFKAVKGSDSLNHTKPINFLQAYQDYVPQGGLILPYPDHENQYILIHQQVEYLVIQDSVADIRGERLYYSIINMNKESGLGEVIERKNILLDVPLDYGNITACRHANGKDWWIIQQSYSEPVYYKILLDSMGMRIFDKQEVGTDDLSSLGQALFSPDGKFYINHDCTGNKTDCAIFNFDRCTGKLSNFKGLKSGIPIDSIFAGGAAISPNSRFLYFILDSYIFQYDLLATDIAQSRVLIAKYDGFLDDNNLPTRFFMGQLAPNGKIYISNTSATRYLHVINKPDLKGDSCDLVQHGYKLLTINGFGLPNLPNFRLGKADVVCNMVGEEDVEKEHIAIKVFPNPNEGILTIDIGENKINSFAVYDINGRFIFSQYIDNQSTTIDISDLQNGMYICRFSGNVDEVTPIKFTIIH